MVAFTIPETIRKSKFWRERPPISPNHLPFSPALLATKARKMRQVTKDDRHYAPMGANRLAFRERLESVLSKPFKILFLEPMMMATTLYMSVGIGLSCPKPLGLTLIYLY